MAPAFVPDILISPRWVVAPISMAIAKVAPMKHSSSSASIAKLVGDLRQHATQNIIAAPSLKPPMYGFVVWVALRQHVPLRCTFCTSGDGKLTIYDKSQGGSRAQFLQDPARASRQRSRAWRRLAAGLVGRASHARPTCCWRGGPSGAVSRTAFGSPQGRTRQSPRRVSWRKTVTPVREPE